MENFPTVLLEAMSAGCAVITSTAGGCPEVVGDAGLLVEPKDVDMLRKMLFELIGSADKRTELGQKALERVHQFSWGSVTQKYLELYQSLINAE